MTTDLARTIAEAYRWQRRLGNTQIAAAHCHIVADRAHPDIWDSNHADEVTARSEGEIESVFEAMDEHLGHTPWRVVHTDCFTPDAFLARLALEDFEERPVTIQMALQGELTDQGAAIDLRPVQRWLSEPARWEDAAARKDILTTARLLETEPTVVGTSAHLLAVGRVV